MARSLPSEGFEDKVRAALSVPGPTTAAIERIEIRLLERSGRQPEAIRHGPTGISVSALFRRRSWVVAIGILLLLLAALGAIGPQRVMAAFRQLLGYIPGVGIVDQSVPIRVLAEPVSLTRQGVTVTVTSAVLTGDRTLVEYRIFGVPRAAYPDREDVVGCSEPEYLRLPDGTRLELSADFPSVPGDVNEAVFVLPCIPNTLPGKAPEDWELHLSFIPAPADLPILPVVELSPSPVPAVEVGATPFVFQGEGVTFDRVIETNEAYILIGRFQPSILAGEWVQVTDVQIRDASGRQVPYTSPPDIQPPNVESVSGGFGFVYAFNGADLSFPLTVAFSGATIHPADPTATATFEFDAGPNPQPGQEWVLNRELDPGGHHLTIVSVTADSRPGYSFKFSTGSDVYGASVNIEGTNPVGGGGGGSGGLSGGALSADLAYTELPTGRLRVTVSNLAVIGDSLTWSGAWSPTPPRTDWPATPTSEPGACVISGSPDEQAPAPANLSAGLALTYEPLDASTWGLVLRHIDGSTMSLQVPDRTWGTLSPDGTELAYPSPDGIHVMDLATRGERVFEGGHGGYNLSWSPNGKQIAFVSDTADGVYVIGLDGGPRRQVSDQAYASVAGWSPDSTRIYVAIPFTGGSAWKMRQIDAATRTWMDLFTIENGTAKFLSPAVSPDAQWLAYRGSDNSSLYLVRMDGTDMHLIMTGVGQVVWSRSGWMGVTTLASDPDQLRAILLRPETCQAFALPGLRGYLWGLQVP
jgi:hypothetical protein